MAESIQDLVKNYTGDFPKVLITTSSDKRCTKYTHKFTEELSNLFANSTVVKKYGASIKKVTGKAIDAGFTDLIVIGEDHKKIIHLPLGPTAVFRMSSVQLPFEIHNHASRTDHASEVTVSNFKTPVGHLISLMLKNLFSPTENLYGRQIASWQNSKDYIFFRQFRYMFETVEKAELQEIGPRFTLKLHKLIKGLYSLDEKQIIWSFKNKFENFKRQEM